VRYESIHSAEELQQFLDSIGNLPCLAFDTEFVSEDRFRPELCLIQVAAADRLVVIDPYTTKDTLPFWDFIATPGRTVIAHAAREEARFCYRFTGRKIAGLFDVQLAAGFAGHEYPISLGNLVHRLQGKTLPKGETRTNWRTRPLTPSQIEYALHDVTELHAMYVELSGVIDNLGRRAWLDQETDDIQETIIEMEEAERWRRVSGSNGLPPRQLEIVRQLWLWREHRARVTDQPPRRILRDDLIVELAKRQSSDIDRIRDIRGMERRGLVGQYEEIAAAIGRALDTKDGNLPRRPRVNRKPVSPMLAQFLSTAVACICRQHGIAPSIVGNSDDVKELLAFELERAAGVPLDENEQLPALLRGWRADVVGRSCEDLLAGRLAIRVADRNEEQPLEFVQVPSS
jgi:ribonuclease D